MILDKDIREIKRSAKLIKELADLFLLTFNERMKVGCGSCIEKDYNRLKQELKNKTMIKIEDKKEQKNNCDFELKVSNIREFNSTKIYTNETLTNEVAIAYIKVNKARLDQFSKYPENIDELLSGKKKRATKKKEPKKTTEE